MSTVDGQHHHFHVCLALKVKKIIMTCNIYDVTYDVIGLLLWFMGSMSEKKCKKSVLEFISESVLSHILLSVEE